MLVLPLLNSVYATSDLSSLGSPQVVIYPKSGPPGTQVTITVTHIPDVSKESYPYPDLYIYLPFSKPFGTTPQSQCGGVDCFPIYTHDDAVNHDFADRIITFTLFSTINPSTSYLNGLENSACDVIVNGKDLQRYSTLCNAKDEPPGTYTIKFGWAEQNAPQIHYIIKTTQFTVMPSSPPPKPQVADNGNSIITAYQKGEITESEFYIKLTALGWDAEQIRKALAVIHKLPHQIGAPVPDEMQQIVQGVQKAAQQYNSQPSVQTTPATSPDQTVQPAPSEQTAQSMTPYITQQPLQQSPQVQQVQPPAQVQTDASTTSQNNPWTVVTIVATLGAAAAIGGGFYTFKLTRKVKN
jgi:hypothetical protein